MALIFTDTLQANDSTGLYTLQAFINNEWTDIHTIAGAQSGSIEVDATLNTITVDTTLLPVGQTFDFRWIDSAGNVSNVVTTIIPFTLQNYYTVQEAISSTSSGGDNWTFTVPYTPPSTEVADTITNQINFFDDSGNETQLIQISSISSDQSYSFTGLGAGTYMIAARYENNAGNHFIVAQSYIKVDGAGNIIRRATFSGFTNVSISGMNISATAQYSVSNATVDPTSTVCIAADATFTNSQPLCTGNVLADQQLPPYNPVVVYCFIGLLDSEWSPGAIDGDVRGCIMTFTNDIV